MSEWKEYKLGEIITIKYGKDHKHLKDGSFPVYGSGGIMRYVEKYLYDKESILIPRKGSLSNIFYKDSAFWTVDTMFWTEIDSTKVFPKFLYYQMTLIDLEILNVGSAVPSLTIPVINDIPISLPSLSEQKRIASILSSLDDKIDLLHRENKTLEAMAETLFRKWFVEEANEDWEEVSILNCIKLIGGGTPKTSEESYWNGNISWLSGGDIANNHKTFTLNSEKCISEEGLNNSSAKLLPENAMVVSARGTVGKYCLLSKPMAFSQSNYGILPIYNDCYFFTYLLVAYHIDELQSAAYGSVFDTITTKTFEGVSILIPKEIGYIVEFEKMIEPYFSKMKQNNKQIQTLTQTRDSLLPKLMSGEIKV